MAQPVTTFRVETFEPSTGTLMATAEGGGLPKQASALCGANITLADKPVGKVLTCDFEPTLSRVRLIATIPPGETRRLITDGVLLGLAVSVGGVHFTDRAVVKQAPAGGVLRPNANNDSQRAIIERLAHTLQKTVERLAERNAAQPNYRGRRLNRNAYLIGRN